MALVRRPPADGLVLDHQSDMHITLESMVYRWSSGDRTLIVDRRPIDAIWAWWDPTTI